MGAYTFALEEACDFADFADFSEPYTPVDPTGKFRHTTIGRTCHWRTCPECEGGGSVTLNRSHNGDPQCDEDVPCPNPECVDGDIDLWVDPILLLRDARRWASRVPYGALRYGEILQRVASPEPLPPVRAAWRRAA